MSIAGQIHQKILRVFYLIAYICVPLRFILPGFQMSEVIPGKFEILTLAGLFHQFHELPPETPATRPAC